MQVQVSADVLVSVSLECPVCDLTTLRSVIFYLHKAHTGVRRYVSCQIRGRTTHKENLKDDSFSCLEVKCNAWWSYCAIGGLNKVRWAFHWLVDIMLELSLTAVVVAISVSLILSTPQFMFIQSIWQPSLFPQVPSGTSFQVRCCQNMCVPLFGVFAVQKVTYSVNVNSMFVV